MRRGEREEGEEREREEREERGERERRRGGIQTSEYPKTKLKVHT